MKVRFLELAQYELDDAFVWYEEQMQGLGRDRRLLTMLTSILVACV